MTLNDQLEAGRGRPTGFDYMDLNLSISIVLWYTIVTSYGQAAQSYALEFDRPTICLGLANLAKLSLLKGADYSYGIFLYGYATQHAWMSVSPALHHWYWTALVTLPMVTLFAEPSWHLVEKPALRQRPLLLMLHGHLSHHGRRFLKPLGGRLAEPARLVEGEQAYGSAYAVAVAPFTRVDGDAAQ